MNANEMPMKSAQTITVLLCGVGGQGTILAADLLAKAALAAGYTAKVSEIHGMSQRGGAVTTIVRFGKGIVSSMVADAGTADCVVSFEKMEALRNLHFLKNDGYLLVADDSITPLPVAAGFAAMPKSINEQLDNADATVIPATRIALEVGSPKSANVVLLGALATQLDFPLDVWEETISKRVPPKTVEANLAAFKKGYDFAMSASK